MEGSDILEQYNVTGMSCAACQTRVEKAVSAVPGVDSCAVSLLTNSMGVEGNADAAAIIKAVENAGYGASLKADNSAGANASVPNYDNELADTETPKIRNRLIASVILFSHTSASPSGALNLKLLFWETRSNIFELT